MEKGKVYRLDMDDEQIGIMRNSFVMMPAVDGEEDIDGTYFAFSKQKLFFSANKSEQMFMSVSLLADVPIPRLNENKETFYIIFTKDDVKKFVKKFMASGNIHKASYNHIPGTSIEGVVLVESFFLDKDRIDSGLFKGVTDGSWITTYYVQDKEKYELLLNDPAFNGFSVELDAHLKPYNEFAEQSIKEIAFSDMPDAEKEEKIKAILSKLT